MRVADMRHGLHPNGKQPSNHFHELLGTRLDMTGFKRARDMLRRIDEEVDAIMADPVRLLRECCLRGRTWPHRPPDSDPDAILPVFETPRASVTRVVAARLCGAGVEYRVVGGLDGSALVVIERFR